MSEIKPERLSDFDRIDTIIDELCIYKFGIDRGYSQTVDMTDNIHLCYQWLIAAFDRIASIRTIDSNIFLAAISDKREISQMMYDEFKKK